MAENKSHIFSADRQYLSGYCNALSHPARVAILELLAEQGRMTCGEITEILPLAQPTVSQHLSKLKQENLVTFEKEGLKSFYRINLPEIERMRGLFYGLINKVSNPL
jgi:ArsR family transcriptional regulator, arsenate/arsenite/antimonite-responsive transcriptional repressor